MWRRGSMRQLPAGLRRAAPAEGGPMPDPGPDPTGLSESELPAAADEWDAGHMGCGEVIILLRLRMRKLNPGDVLKLTSQDLGAPEDLPA